MSPTVRSNIGFLNVIFLPKPTGLKSRKDLKKWKGVYVNVCTHTARCMYTHAFFSGKFVLGAVGGWCRNQRVMVYVATAPSVLGTQNSFHAGSQTLTCAQQQPKLWLTADSSLAEIRLWLLDGQIQDILDYSNCIIDLPGPQKNGMVRELLPSMIHLICRKFVIPEAIFFFIFTWNYFITGTHKKEITGFLL